MFIDQYLIRETSYIYPGPCDNIWLLG